MSRKSSRGRRTAPPSPPPDLLRAMLGAAATAAAGSSEDAPPAGTRLEVLCAKLHERCSIPFPSTHSATAPHHVREARELLAALDEADDAPAPVDEPLNRRETAAERLEEAESILRDGDLGTVAVELRHHDNARTRAIADALLGIRR